MGHDGLGPEFHVNFESGSGWITLVVGRVESAQ